MKQDRAYAKKLAAIARNLETGGILRFGRYTIKNVNLFPPVYLVAGFSNRGEHRIASGPLRDMLELASKWNTSDENEERYNRDLLRRIQDPHFKVNP